MGDAEPEVPDPAPVTQEADQDQQLADDHEGDVGEMDGDDQVGEQTVPHRPASEAREEVAESMTRRPGSYSRIRPAPGTATGLPPGSRSASGSPPASCRTPPRVSTGPAPRIP